ncbi:hypothetical protein Barb7_02180 [Bacteroidales bacterium Barb7]|nr:hypothetical protein Barb7_02180 [Bacteroidales bacterium Barb7]
MQTTGHLIAFLVEFTAGMEHREHHFQRRFTFFLVEIDRNASPVVNDGHRVILVDKYINVLAMTCQRLVNGVIHDLVNQMMKSLFADVANVHGRPFAHGFQSFKHLNTLCRVFGGCVLNLFAHVLFLVLVCYCRCTSKSRQMY